MIVDVLVDHLLGGAEQTHQFGREEVAWIRRGGVRLHSLLSRRNPRRMMRGRACMHTGRPRGILHPAAIWIDVSACEPPTRGASGASVCSSAWPCARDPLRRATVNFFRSPCSRPARCPSSQLAPNLHAGWQGGRHSGWPQCRERLHPARWDHGRALPPRRRQP